MSKKKPVAEATLSKKDRKALKAREAELAAELAKREAEKAAKRAKKKGKKGGKKADPMGADALGLAPVAEPHPHSSHLAHVGDLMKVINDPTTKKKTRKAAQAELDALRAEGEAINAAKAARAAKRGKAVEAALIVEMTEDDAERATALHDDVDAQIAARLEAKRPGSPERTDAMQAKVAADRAEREQAWKDAAAEASGGVVSAMPADEPMVAEVVETEKGREFAVGTPQADDDFAKPSEAPRDDFEVNGNGQYKVSRPSDGKLVGYTRVTTFIACLEDTTTIEKWKARVTLEGVAAIETAAATTLEDGHAPHDSVVARVNDLVHRRDVAIARARKADRKGKLEIGELATYVNGAWSDFKKGLDALADEVFEVGGGREKAQKGTDLHALCDLYDSEGMQAIADKLAEGEITPADMADVEAYADAMQRIGAKVIESERVVVDDEGKIAGRLDRVVMVKLPGEQRARRRVLDIKTGRVDYGAAKIAMQLAKYAEMTGYDLNTHEREDLKIDRAKGILLHLPAGEAKAHVHVVDLTVGRRGLALAKQVRTWRSEGKRAIDLKADVLDELGSEG
jgi:hypothetical protein